MQHALLSMNLSADAMERPTAMSAMPPIPESPALPQELAMKKIKAPLIWSLISYSTVTDFAKFLG
jgi:hypothetical protein